MSSRVTKSSPGSLTRYRNSWCASPEYPSKPQCRTRSSWVSRCCLLGSMALQASRKLPYLLSRRPRNSDRASCAFGSNSSKVREPLLFWSRAAQRALMSPPTASCCRARQNSMKQILPFPCMSSKCLQAPTSDPHLFTSNLRSEGASSTYLPRFLCHSCWRSYCSFFLRCKSKRSGSRCASCAARGSRSAKVIKSWLGSLRRYLKSWCASPSYPSSPHFCTKVSSSTRCFPSESKNLQAARKPPYLATTTSSRRESARSALASRSARVMAPLPSVSSSRQSSLALPR
mmetsp:Transcript_15240/g.47925  ORF Transcript_15240/g.47925 Transcript_15240/m.47925 type:complete len:287 (+) Transcript_15240:1151-2011(+)